MDSIIPAFDPASRRALRWMLIRLCAVVLIWTLPWVLGRVPFSTVLIVLPIVLTIAAISAAVVASVRGERMCGNSLNTWDEAAAFSGISFLVHAISRMVL